MITTGDVGFGSDSLSTGALVVVLTGKVFPAAVVASVVADGRVYNIAPYVMAVD